jgi:hypothetical protein
MIGTSTTAVMRSRRQNLHHLPRLSPASVRDLAVAVGGRVVPALEETDAVVISSVPF